MMKVLIADDTLGSPSLVQPLLQELAREATVLVAATMAEIHEVSDLALIILGGRYLQAAQEVRQAHPKTKIIGRLPWIDPPPKSFFPWGDELHAPTVDIIALVNKTLRP